MSYVVQTAWLNPYGYLPGELFYFLPFFGSMLIAYIILALTWALQCWRHWSQLLPLQVQCSFAWSGLCVCSMRFLTP